MSEGIQRVPRGLNNLLSLQSGRTPQQLSDQIQGSLELLQLYGLTQLTIASANNAALAEGGSVQLIPSARDWSILFAATVTIAKTATMTALRGVFSISKSNTGLPYASVELGPFGATETGPVHVCWQGAFPVLLPPGAVLFGIPAIIGTDATADVTLQAEFGLLG